MNPPYELTITANQIRLSKALGATSLKPTVNAVLDRISVFLPSVQSTKLMLDYRALTMEILSPSDWAQVYDVLRIGGGFDCYPTSISGEPYMVIEKVI